MVSITRELAVFLLHQSRSLVSRTPACPWSWNIEEQEVRPLKRGSGPALVGWLRPSRHLQTTMGRKSTSLHFLHTVGSRKLKPVWKLVYVWQSLDKGYTYSDQYSEEPLFCNCSSFALCLFSGETRLDPLIANFERPFSIGRTDHPSCGESGYF